MVIIPYWDQVSLHTGNLQVSTVSPEFLKSDKVFI
jgi:hypothetical protein